MPTAASSRLSSTGATLRRGSYLRRRRDGIGRDDPAGAEFRPSMEVTGAGATQRLRVGVRELATIGGPQHDLVIGDPGRIAAVAGPGGDTGGVQGA